MKLEKCYMKLDLDEPYLWIIEMERLNREVEKCENGTLHSKDTCKRHFWRDYQTEDMSR